MKKKTQKHLSDIKVTKIPERLTAHVIETKSNIKRSIMIGFFSFLITVITIFVSFQFPRIVGEIKKVTLGFMPKEKINLDNTFLNGVDQSVDPLLVKNIIDRRDPTWIFVDYRSPAEFKASHIKGAINIPLYLDFKAYLESTVSLDIWYADYWKVQKLGKKVLLYGYWDKSKMAQNLAQFLTKKGEHFYLLNMGFYEFKSNYYQWVPGGDMNDVTVAAYLEGTFVEPPRADGVPANPTTK
ncbi:MAG: rhodanese-like domain-containing protein [Candidatus Roizmanbacteria bacterium]|nr:rhodanese-like domain-containing protein [Candidatus Roizmanbacteria bacterium]